MQSHCGLAIRLGGTDGLGEAPCRVAVPGGVQRNHMCRVTVSPPPLPPYHFLPPLPRPSSSHLPG